MPAPKLVRRLPAASNFWIGSSLEPMQSARPQRSYTHTLLRSRSMSTLIDCPILRPSGAFEPAGLVLIGLGRGTLLGIGLRQRRTARQRGNHGRGEQQAHDVDTWHVVSSRLGPEARGNEADLCLPRAIAPALRERVAETYHIATRRAGIHGCRVDRGPPEHPYPREQTAVDARWRECNPRNAMGSVDAADVGPHNMRKYVKQHPRTEAR